MQRINSDDIIEIPYYSQNTDKMKYFKICISDILNLIVPILCCISILMGIILIISTYY
jgi:hypothetical protein